MPMTTILLSDLSGRDVADAASLSTFVRTIGASFASSLTTWYWTREASVHHSVMAEHITPYNPLVASALRGNVEESMVSVNAMITSQSYMMSTIDLFTFLMGLFIVLVPFIFFTKKPQRE